MQRCPSLRSIAPRRFCASRPAAGRSPRSSRPHMDEGGARRVTAPQSGEGGHERAPSSYEDELAAALAEAREAAAAATRASLASAAAAETATSAAARAEALLALAGRLPAPAPPSASTERAGRVLPRRIIVIRHGESAGNLDESLYCRVPDPEIPLTRRGYDQGLAAGRRFRELLEADERETGIPGRLFLYVSPYRRSKQTAAAIVSQFPRSAIMGVREEPQLREQDFGNFQDRTQKLREKEERLAYGRFFFRFPNGESGADVFDRITVFEDHMVRDIDSGRFPEGTTLLVCTHGLSLRIFLARWLHWTVSEYESVFNPPNCAPIVLERMAAASGDDELCTVDASACDPVNASHTKNLYRLSEESLRLLGVMRNAAAVESMKSMLLPEQAWERVLRGDEWKDDEDEAECQVTPSDFEQGRSAS